MFWVYPPVNTTLILVKQKINCFNDNLTWSIEIDRELVKTVQITASPHPGVVKEPSYRKYVDLFDGKRLSNDITSPNGPDFPTSSLILSPLLIIASINGFWSTVNWSGKIYSNCEWVFFKIVANIKPLREREYQEQQVLFCATLHHLTMRISDRDEPYGVPDRI